MQYIGHFLLVGAIFAIIDAIWIGVVANKFYKSQMEGLLMDKPNLVPAVAFYVIYIIAILVLALEPALSAQSPMRALGLSAMFGFAAYATYDLTNASTLKNWPRAITLVDIIWGTSVTTAVTYIAYVILS